MSVIRIALVEDDAQHARTVTDDPERYRTQRGITLTVAADGTQGAWVLDAGTYSFAIGNGAHKALNNLQKNEEPFQEGPGRSAPARPADPVGHAVCGPRRRLCLLLPLAHRGLRHGAVLARHFGL